MDIDVGATISTETHCIESYINRHDFKAEIFGDSPKISKSCVTRPAR